MKGLEEAPVDLCPRLAGTGRPQPNPIGVEDALGRVTAAPVYAGVSAPTYHSAAMDGIAVKAEATYGAADNTPKILQIGEDAVWVNTGQALPEGYNAVIMVEKIQSMSEDCIEIRGPAYPWQNIRKVGEDIVATQLLFAQNHRIRAYDLGALVAAGVRFVSVRKRPNVAILPTGSELVSHRDAHDFDPLQKNRIIDSNSVTLSGLVREAHAEPHVFPITPRRGRGHPRRP